MNEREAERLADQLAQEASAEAYAREHGMITSAPGSWPAPMTATERIAMLGRAESAGRFGADQYVPLEPVRVVTRAEMDAQAAERTAMRTPMVPYREPVDHQVPVIPPKIDPAQARFIRQSIEDGYDAVTISLFRG